MLSALLSSCIGLSACGGGTEISTAFTATQVAEAKPGEAPAAAAAPVPAQAGVALGQPSASLVDLPDNSLVAALPQSANTTGAVGPGTLPNSARPTSGIGINVAAFAYYAPDFPLIDQFKRGSGWLTQCDGSSAQCRNLPAGASSWDTLEESSLNLDENGWIKALPAAGDTSVRYRSVSTLLFQGNGGAHPAGQYIVLYDGQGTVSYSLAGRKVAAQSKPGRDIVEVSNKPSDGGLLISINSTQPGDYIRNIRVLPPGGVCSALPAVYVTGPASCSGGTFQSFEVLYKTRIWHPAFLADMRGFRAIRFVDWTLVNTTKLSTWAQRPKASDAFWSSNKGVPVEVMLDLAKSAGADPWINLPPYADDNYIQQFAKLVKAQLPESSLLYVENGNEPWNYAPPFGIVGGLYESLARAKWPAARNDGTLLRLNWYAYRSAKICQMVKQEYGSRVSQVRCVANAQAVSPWAADQLLSCPLANGELGGNCANWFDALAIAPYFGYYIPQLKFKPTIDSWLAQPDGGLSSLFREITGRDANGGLATPPLFEVTRTTPGLGSLASSRDAMVAMKLVADKYGLPLMAYEAGQHIVPGPDYQDAGLTKLLLSANRDARMGAAYTTNMVDWKAAGGQLFTHYNYASQGVGWGLKDAQFQASTAKWNAVKAFRDGTSCWWPGCTTE